MADWSLPTTSSNYSTVFLPQLLARDVDIATMFTQGTPTNIPNGAFKWNAANNRWETYNSGTSTWSAWTTTLAVTTVLLGQDPTAALQAATKQYTDNGLALKAPLASPALTGTPTAPTATAGTNSTQVATTAFVAASFAPLASPALTGTPTAPTAAITVSNTQIATTAFVQGLVGTSSAVSVAGGVDVTLTAAQYSAPIIVLSGALTGNINVIFPTSTKSWIVQNSTSGAYTLTCKTASGSGVIIAQGKSNALWGDGSSLYAEQSDFTNTVLTGTPTAPTAVAGTNTTQVATTAFVAASFAPLASPALTGTPTAPTAVAGTNTTQVATTAFVTASFAPLASPALTGTPTAPTAVAGTNTTQVATTAFVAASFAPLASPALTGTPTAPTAPVGTNTTQVATTAFVTTATQGVTTVSVAGGVSVTLTAAQYGSTVIRLTGALTASINVVFPNNGSWVIQNATSGAFTITCKTNAGTGTVVTQGKTSEVIADGTNVVLSQTDFISPALTGTPTAPTAAVSTNTTQVATTAFVLGQAATAAPLMDGVAAVGTSLLYARQDHVHASDTSLAPLASPALTGTPTAPTAAANTNTTQIATTAFVASAVSPLAPLTSPALTGTPTAPTAAISTNTTQLATTAFVLGQAATAAPLMNGVAAVGASLLYARQDHVHASDTSLAPLASPTLTGTPTAPTAAVGDNSTLIATTAFVQALTRSNTSVNVAGGSNVTLTQAQYGVFSITLTGALTANISVIFPNTGSWVVDNQTTGAYTVTCKTSAGTGVVVTQGQTQAIFANGTNVKSEQSDFANITGPVTITDSSASDAAALTLKAASDTNGVNLLMVGNGATTPNKTIRVSGGNFQVLNNAYSSAILTMDDSGNLTATGNIGGYSDERLKENIETIPDALALVGRMRGVAFNRKDLEGRPRQVGVIAQEMREVVPEAVQQDGEGMLSVAYGNLVGVLIEAVKELTARVAQLEAVQ